MFWQNEQQAVSHFICYVYNSVQENTIITSAYCNAQKWEKKVQEVHIY